MADEPTEGGPENIEDEVRSSFLAYSMSVIISRALPDVRDGLKPVHRRILYAMNQEGMLPTRPHKKSVGVVGEVLKHYTPTATARSTRRWFGWPRISPCVIR